MSDEDVQVSIGLPVYNGEDYLAETLDSLLGQTYPRFELIVCDNASSDGTEAICRERAERDPRLRYHRWPENLGAAENYNACVRLARGRYFRWAAHDDLLTPDCLERCVEALEAAPPDVILCYPRTVLIDEHGAELRDHPDRMALMESAAHQRLAHFARVWGMCNPIFGLMRREVLERTGLIRPYISSDVVLLAELSMLGRFQEVPVRGFLRRIHVASSRQGDLSLADVARWFDPKARGGWDPIPPRLRIFGRILGLIRRAPLPALERLRCAGAFTAAWIARRTRVRIGSLRRRLRGAQPARG